VRVTRRFNYDGELKVQLMLPKAPRAWRRRRPPSGRQNERSWSCAPPPARRGPRNNLVVRVVATFKGMPVPHEGRSMSRFGKRPHPERAETRRRQRGERFEYQGKTQRGPFPACSLPFSDLSSPCLGSGVRTWRQAIMRRYRGGRRSRLDWDERGRRSGRKNGRPGQDHPS